MYHKIYVISWHLLLFSSTFPLAWFKTSNGFWRFTWVNVICLRKRSIVILFNCDTLLRYLRYDIIMSAHLLHDSVQLPKMIPMSRWWWRGQLWEKSSPVCGRGSDISASWRTAWQSGTSPGGPGKATPLVSIEVCAHLWAWLYIHDGTVHDVC